MRRKQFINKSIRDVLNTDVMHSSVVNFKPPPIPELFASNLPNSRLKDKVTSLVQMQIKNNQSNQNFLNHDKASALINSLATENDRKELIMIYVNTKYDIVSEVALNKNFKIVSETEDWNILWIDGSINSSKAFNLKRHQRVNHFPGMNEISRKDKLQKNLKIMQRYFPMDYDIFPKTWTLPSEKLDILSYLRDRTDLDGDTFIIKPACSSQGRGIILISDVKNLSVVGNTICQLYISNPFLIDGFKFDLRIYVLITSCDPFRIYVYEEGLARFATHTYEKPNHHNINNVYMHLTNYSVQRNSERYDSDEYTGTKRRASTIYEWFKNNGYDAEAIWKSIDDVLIKTMLCANNSIQHHYSATFPDQYRTSACFELLGFDIILDDTLKPYVLEVNHSPSLETETPLDHGLKSQLLNDVFNLINSVPVNMRKITDLERLRSAERLYWSRNKYMSSRKAAYEFRKVLSEIQVELERCEMDNRNGFRILYPVLGQTEKYQRFFEFNCEHHRNYFNRCVLLDESEHRKFIELQKESLPKVMKRSINTMDLSKFTRGRLANGDVGRNYRGFNTAREPHLVTKALTFNMGLMRHQQQRDAMINGVTSGNTSGSANRANVTLLDHSKRSLQRILSNKSQELLIRHNQERHGPMQVDSGFRRSSASTSNLGTTSRQEDTEVTSLRSSTVRQRMKHHKKHQASPVPSGLQPPTLPPPSQQGTSTGSSTAAMATKAQLVPSNGAPSDSSALGSIITSQEHDPTTPTPTHSTIVATTSAAVNSGATSTVVHQVQESNLNEQTSVNLEWESSLISHKLHHLSNIMISEPDISANSIPGWLLHPHDQDAKHDSSGHRRSKRLGPPAGSGFTRIHHSCQPSPCTTISGSSDPPDDLESSSSKLASIWSQEAQTQQSPNLPTGIYGDALAICSDHDDLMQEHSPITEERIESKSPKIIEMSEQSSNYKEFHTAIDSAQIHCHSITPTMSPDCDKWSGDKEIGDPPEIHSIKSGGMVVQSEDKSLLIGSNDSNDENDQNLVSNILLALEQPTKQDEKGNPVTEEGSCKWDRDEESPEEAIDSPSQSETKINNPIYIGEIQEIPYGAVKFCDLKKLSELHPMHRNDFARLNHSIAQERVSTDNSHMKKPESVRNSFVLPQTRITESTTSTLTHRVHRGSRQHKPHLEKSEQHQSTAIRRAIIEYLYTVNSTEPADSKDCDHNSSNQHQQPQSQLPSRSNLALVPQGYRESDNSDSTSSNKTSSRIQQSQLPAEAHKNNNTSTGRNRQLTNDISFGPSFASVETRPSNRKSCELHHKKQHHHRHKKTLIRSAHVSHRRLSTFDREMSFAINCWHPVGPQGQCNVDENPSKLDYQELEPGATRETDYELNRGSSQNSLFDTVTLLFVDREMCATTVQDVCEHFLLRLILFPVTAGQLDCIGDSISDLTIYAGTMGSLHGYNTLMYCVLRDAGALDLQRFGFKITLEKTISLACFRRTDATVLELNYGLDLNSSSIISMSLGFYGRLSNSYSPPSSQATLKNLEDVLVEPPMPLRPPQQSNISRISTQTRFHRHRNRHRTFNTRPTRKEKLVNLLLMGQPVPPVAALITRRFSPYSSPSIGSKNRLKLLDPITVHRERKNFLQNYVMDLTAQQGAQNPSHKHFFHHPNHQIHRNNHKSISKTLQTG